MKNRFEDDPNEIDRVMTFLKYGCPNSNTLRSVRSSGGRKSMLRQSWPGLCFCGLKWCGHFTDLEYIRYEAGKKPEVMGDIYDFLAGGCGPAAPAPTPAPPTPKLTGLTS